MVCGEARRGAPSILGARSVGLVDASQHESTTQEAPSVREHKLAAPGSLCKPCSRARTLSFYSALRPSSRHSFTVKEKRVCSERTIKR